MKPWGASSYFMQLTKSSLGGVSAATPVLGRWIAWRFSAIDTTI